MTGSVSNRLPGATRTVLVTPVYEALKERIMDQTVLPGTRLNIDALALVLGVSPTPVRESLARLAAERLVIFEPFKGYTVRPLLTLRQFADLMYVRRMLEADATRLAATRITFADLRAMGRTIDAMVQAHPEPRFRDYRSYNQHDQRFHEILIAAAENPVLLETYQTLHVHIQLARLYRDRGAVDVDDSLTEHRALLAALEARDPDAAVEAIRAHIDGVERRLGELLETRLTSSPGT